MLSRGVVRGVRAEFGVLVTTECDGVILWGSRSRMYNVAHLLIVHRSVLRLVKGRVVGWGHWRQAAGLVLGALAYEGHGHHKDNAPRHSADDDDQAVAPAVYTTAPWTAPAYEWRRIRRHRSWFGFSVCWVGGCGVGYGSGRAKGRCVLKSG